MQDLLATALDAPTGKRTLDASTRRLRSACERRDAWRTDGACLRHATAPVRGHVRAAPLCMRALRHGACGPTRAAPWRLHAPRLRRACARRCRALRRRLGRQIKGRGG